MVAKVFFADFPVNEHFKDNLGVFWEKVKKPINALRYKYIGVRGNQLEETSSITISYNIHYGFHILWFSCST
jgi:hypothetical protein